MADLQIAWPSGVRESVEGLRADQFVTVKEGVGVVARERFGS
jgi:DNA-binding FadR family transcriptional regulator